RSEGEVYDLVNSATADSVHICQGIRSNRVVRFAQRALATRGLEQWVIMETVDDSGWTGYVKRLIYSMLFRRTQGTLTGVLANGYRTASWVTSRGVNAAKVFPFAYFLPWQPPAIAQRRIGPFRFRFAGQLIPRK